MGQSEPGSRETQRKAGGCAREAQRTHSARARSHSSSARHVRSADLPFRLTGTHDSPMSLTRFELECTRCGACCAPRETWTTYVHVTVEERQRLPRRFALRVIEDELATLPDFEASTSDLHNTPHPQTRGSDTPFRRGPGVRCVALRGELGRDVGCEIHADRPAVCRRFRVGSRACLEARAEVLGL